LCGVTAALVFYAGLARVRASQASVLTLMEPLVAVIVGALVWHEVPGPWALVGGALVLGGAALIVTAPES
jgi:drug/metabolite transporter (DMT)-like permease